MDKKLRQKLKRGLKKDISSALPYDVDMSATLSDDESSWEVWMSVDFPIPEGLERVSASIEEDVQRPMVVQWMQARRDEIAQIMKTTFSAELKANPRDWTKNSYGDFNYTVPLPPLFLARMDGNTVRLLTDSEKDEVKAQSDFIRSAIESEEKLLLEGYFEFLDGVDDDLDCFAYRKYAGLRARYTFTVPCVSLVA